MSELTLVIGNKNYSSWSLRPWIYMKKKGIKFTEKRIALHMENTTKLLEPYFSGYKVPVLIDDGLLIWDSLAILEYLAEKYPDHNGWPNNSNARATARSAVSMPSGLPNAQWVSTRERSRCCLNRHGKIWGRPVAKVD